MSHKEEAERQAVALEFGDVSSNFHTQTGELKSDAIALVQLKATLALVEAQERANEQARIANLIALGVAPGVSFEVHEQVIAVLTQDAGNDVYPLAPEIARALGIGGAE